MICPKCGDGMSGGAPHCETIRAQWECGCGNIETELYTAEEIKVYELCASSEFSPKECRAALGGADYDLKRAARRLEEKRLGNYCKSFGATAASFAEARMKKPLGEITDPGLQILMLIAGNIAGEGTPGGDRPAAKIRAHKNGEFLLN